MEEEGRVHPDCINASNPYHECVEYCFRKIAEAKARMAEKETGKFCLCADLSFFAVFFNRYVFLKKKCYGDFTRNLDDSSVRLCNS